MIHFSCPSCKRGFAVDNSLGGKAGKCSWCGAPISIPKPYAEGIRTDEARDPRIEEELTHEQAAHDSDQVPDLRLPEYHDQPVPQTGGGNPAQGWIIVVVVIILLNLILVPLTGFAIVPR